MLKIKYLHRKSRDRRNRGYWTYNSNKNIDIFDDIPFHEKMRKKYYAYWPNMDFTPLYEFINSKIGQDWNDVYSEILKKTKKKYRHDIDDCLGGSGWFYMVKTPIYDEDMIPRDENGRILRNIIFVDYNNILTKKSEEELLVDSKRYIRKIKMMKILESQENEQFNEESINSEN